MEKRIAEECLMRFWKFWQKIEKIYILSVDMEVFREREEKVIMKITMENIKRPVNFNFLAIMILVILLFLAGLVMWSAVLDADAELLGMKGEINEIQSRDEIGDVEGYGLLGYMIAYGVGSFVVMAVKILFVWIPLFMGLILLVLAVLSRAVYADNGGRLLMYRIIMGIGYILLAAMAGLLAGLLSMWSGILAFVLVGSLLAYVTAIIILGIRNTYTDRIKN